MTKKDIIDAYCRIRTIDNTISDEVLDFMKDAAIEKLERMDFAEKFEFIEGAWQLKKEYQIKTH